MTKEIWEALLDATHALENNDSTMSGDPTRKAELAREWLLAQDWTDFDDR